MQAAGTLVGGEGTQKGSDHGGMKEGVQTKSMRHLLLIDLGKDLQAGQRAWRSSRCVLSFKPLTMAILAQMGRRQYNNDCV